MTPDLPRLIAHRGYARHYPENTLVAMEAAIAAGARYIETDIQLSADRTPFLFHDEALLRTTGEPGLITATADADIRRLDAAEASRLDGRFSGIAIPRLSELVTLLLHSPDCHALIEIKEESLRRFGTAITTDRVLAELEPLQGRCILISYDEQCLRHARRQGWPIGWVMRAYDPDHRDIATHLRPDYLICNYLRTGADRLWPGPWQWALYEVVDPQLALTLAARGAAMIETMAIGELLAAPAFRESAHERT